MKVECNSSVLMIEAVLDVSDRNHTSVSAQFDCLHDSLELLWPCSEANLHLL